PAPALPSLLRAFPTRRSSDLASGPLSGRIAHNILSLQGIRVQRLNELYHLAELAALSIMGRDSHGLAGRIQAAARLGRGRYEARDRKSTRLNSSHQIISYAVF